jgi:hypothetical protein
MKTMSKIEALAKKNAKKAEAKETQIVKRESGYSKEELFRYKCMDAVQTMRDKKEQEEYTNSLKNESKGN